RFKSRRDLAFQPLPGVPRAFNQFDAIVSHGNCSAYLKNSFAFSKKPFRIGVFSSPQRAANSSSLRRCSPFKRDGTSTISRANKSPCPRPLTLTIPFPRSLNICPLCVPAVTLRCALPSKVGTSISPPKAAAGRTTDPARAGCGAAAPAFLASIQFLDLDLFFRAKSCLLESDLHVVTQI